MGYYIFKKKELIEQLKDVHDLNMCIIKEKMKNSLYILSDLDKEIMAKPYKAKKRKKK